MGQSIFDPVHYSVVVEMILATATMT